MEKEKEIKKELDKLTKIFKDIPEAKRKLVDNLIQNAAFMAVTLRTLQEEINENGPVVVGMTGNGFEMVKENPASKQYTSLVARYSNIIRQLTDLLPDQRSDEVTKAGDALAAFIQKGKNVTVR